jgi:segregation and condensation protein A
MNGVAEMSQRDQKRGSTQMPGATAPVPQSETPPETITAELPLAAPQQEQEGSAGRSPEPARKPAESSSAYRVRVGGLYEGPLDLLLDLIRKQDFNIYDLPIAQLTSQYLVYVQNLKDLDIEVAGDFLLMAATLIQIKSRLLLPADPLLPGEIAVDPRDELVQRLLEYEKFKRAAELLHEKQQIENATWSHPLEFDPTGLDVDAELAVTTYDLVRAFQTVLERLKERPTLDLTREELSVADMIEYLRRLLRAGDEPLSLQRIFSGAGNRRALVSCFLAVLELVRLQAVKLRQERAFGDILIARAPGFERAFTSEPAGQEVTNDEAERSSN